MIHPNMATMLSTVTTDIRIAPGPLHAALCSVVDRTFNCLTVDGDSSTNDTVFILANGASQVAATDGRTAAFFQQGLEMLCGELAQSIARDGEGATKFVEVLVRGARDFHSARTVAKAIANSSLVKTALYGEEFNWGRILCAAGYSGVAFSPSRIALSLNGIPVFRDGAPVSSTLKRAEREMKAHDLLIEVDLGTGSRQARVWTCDLSHEYVDINGSYIT